MRTHGEREENQDQPIQRRAGGAPEAASAGGGGGGGNALPASTQAQMGNAFDFDFSGVRVHEGSQAGAMGALAYTQGTDVHFAPGQYDPASGKGQELIGHELAHVVQQSEGRVAATTQMKGEGLNEDEGLEREADDQGARAARGESVRTGGGSVRATGGPVQRYKAFPTAGGTDSKGGVHWANATALRVSEDGTAAVAQERTSGGQQMYVLDSRLPGINAGLAAVHSPVRFVKDAGQVTGADPLDLEKPQHTLDRVRPVEASDGVTTKKIPDDCGNAARTVSGTIADGKQLHAEYNDKNNAHATTANTDPELMKYEIMVEHFGAQMPHAATVLADVAAAIAGNQAAYDKLKPHIAGLNAARALLDDATAKAKPVMDQVAAVKQAHEAKVALVAAADPDRATKLKALDDAYEAEKLKLKPLVDAARLAWTNANAAYTAFLAKVDAPTGKTVSELLTGYFDAAKLKNDLIAEIMGPYLALSAVQREAFDKKSGTNRHANPDVGDAYTISSGGADKPGTSTWNFHWAGVIFKSTTGSDNITMENYAGNQNTEWRLQMYGVPTQGDARNGQTFHEKHYDTNQHGELPTTMSTEKK